MAEISKDYLPMFILNLLIVLILFFRAYALLQSDDAQQACDMSDLIIILNKSTLDYA